MMNEHAPVVIVGGGVVGLTASLFLAQAGVRSILVERHPGTSIHPRARGLNGRTMELMRGLGLEPAIRKAGEKIAPSMGFYSGRTLVEVLLAKGEGGWLTRRMRRSMKEGRGSSKSPTGACRVTQDVLEPVLLEAARARGVDVRFSTTVTDLQQDSDGVWAELENRQTGEHSRIRASFAIAADGARSGIRERLGISQSGEGVLSHQLNLYFRADLERLVKGREFSMCLVENAQVRGLFASVNNADLWVLHVPYEPGRGERPEDFTPERCAEIIRCAVGLQDLDVELKGVMPWQSTVRIADRFRAGRNFLAGDAAHVMPPWGGFGANTGIQDAQNLAWKLAAVLQGRAGPELLDTYEAERQPIARHVSAIAGSMNDERGLLAARSVFAMFWGLRRAWPYFVVGYGYASSAVIPERGVAPGPGTRDLRGRPGTRVPHLWCELNGQKVSTVDLATSGFTLFLGAEAGAWRDAGQAAFETLGLPGRIFQVGRELEPLGGSWSRAFGVSARGAVLVRPDGFVAWRARSDVGASNEALLSALESILSAKPSGAPLRESAAAFAR